MFFNRDDCPNGWKKIDGAEGRYLRIKTSAESNGQKIEQMVHKHKHDVPRGDALTSKASVNSTRYGPFRSEQANKKGDIYGDRVYNQLLSDYYNVKSKTGEVTLNEANKPAKEYASALITSGGYGGEDNNNWYFYTSDGMNRQEYMRTSGGYVSSFSVCPNRGGASVCNESSSGSGVVKPFTFEVNIDGHIRQITVKNLPYLSDMALVGEENRPNSIAYLACEKE